MKKLYNDGWTVLRFWGSQIEKDLLNCTLKIEELINDKKMNFTEKISLEEISGKRFKIRVIEPRIKQRCSLDTLFAQPLKWCF